MHTRVFSVCTHKGHVLKCQCHVFNSTELMHITHYTGQSLFSHSNSVMSCSLYLYLLFLVHTYTPIFRITEYAMGLCKLICKSFTIINTHQVSRTEDTFKWMMRSFITENTQKKTPGHWQCKYRCLPEFLVRSWAWVTVYMEFHMFPCVPLCFLQVLWFLSTSKTTLVCGTATFNLKQCVNICAYTMYGVSV